MTTLEKLKLEIITEIGKKYPDWDNIKIMICEAIDMETHKTHRLKIEKEARNWILEMALIAKGNSPSPGWELVK